ncbi:MAG TPA: sigma 54-interacting transcriptional regulator [Kofleriaceae bacterium]|nr:sigma 54-interacting transcriptional regulator [Kofleriaceae bacterium]
MPAQRARIGSAQLVITTAGGPPRTVPLGEALASGAVVIGSDPEQADVAVDDLHVSARHCELTTIHAGVKLADLGSRNGTKVQGIAVHSALLEPGVVITIGTTEIRFEEAASEEAAEEDAGEGDALDLEGPSRFGDALGHSAAMRRVFGVLQRIAPTDLTITILGETGTGKDVLARAIHEASPRRSAPFVVFDCGAAAPTLIESQLFGHERGAFTGAVDQRRGAFEQAHGGTLFLDEIGELSLDLQPKLLRVLEQRQVSRLGSTTERPVDVRIVCATNRELAREVATGQFRQDLFFRVNVAVVRLPPLRERPEDVVPLIQHFAAQTEGLEVSTEALGILTSYDWPGNVRELRNVIQSAAAVSDGKLLRPRDFILFSGQTRAPTLDGLPLAGRTLESIECAAIRQTLQQFSGNKTQAARALGIAPSTLYAKLKKYALE